MAEILVVVSKVKKMVKDAGFRTGQDYIVSLSEKLKKWLRLQSRRPKQPETRRRSAQRTFKSVLKQKAFTSPWSTRLRINTQSSFLSLLTSEHMNL